MRHISSFVERRKRLTALLRFGSCALIAALFMAPTSSTTYDFVVSSLAIDADDASPAAGFNLDGRYSIATDTLGCSVADRVSDLDSDQNMGGCSYLTPSCPGGVDNVLPRLLSVTDNSLRRMGTPFRTLLGRRFAGGHIVLLVRLEGVDSLSDDPDVVVSLYHGYSADTSCSALFGGAGQFYIANDSLTISGDPTHPLWQASGSIVNGRLKVRYGTNASLAAEAPTGFAINQLMLRATLSTSGQVAWNGNAGGWVTGSTTRDLASKIYPRLRTILDLFIAQIDDLPSLTSGSCGGAIGNPIGGAGIGLRFAMVQATILGTASQPISGKCGAN